MPEPGAQRWPRMVRGSVVTHRRRCGKHRDAPRGAAPGHRQGRREDLPQAGDPAGWLTGPPGRRTCTPRTAC
jgi:hypothetical protein